MAVEAVVGPINPWISVGVALAVVAVLGVLYAGVRLNRTPEEPKEGSHVHGGPSTSTVNYVTDSRDLHPPMPRPMRPQGPIVGAPGAGMMGVRYDPDGFSVASGVGGGVGGVCGVENTGLNSLGGRGAVG